MQRDPTAVGINYTQQHPRWIYHGKQVCLNLNRFTVHHLAMAMHTELYAVPEQGNDGSIPFQNLSQSHFALVCQCIPSGSISPILAPETVRWHPERGPHFSSLLYTD